MSLDKPPPSRYRVEEKDRRLIVHDTLTGKVVGNAFGTMPERQPPASPAVPPKPEQRPGPKPQPLPAAGFDQARINRIIVVLTAAFFLAFILIFTGAWFLAIIPFLVPQVRQALWPKLKAAVLRYINRAS